MVELQDVVLACPTCRKVLNIKRHRRKDGSWRCHFCSAIFTTPNKRSRTYFSQVLGYRVRKTPVFDELGHKIMGEYNTVQKPIVRMHKRAFKDDDIIKREEALALLKRRYGDTLYKANKRDLRNAAFISFLFLTGARIEEIVGMPLLNDDRKKILGEWQIEPVRKYQISKVLYKRRDLILWQVENMPVLKRKTDDAVDSDSGTLKKVVIRRTVSVPYNIERNFIDYIDRWLAHLTKDDDIVFDFVPESGRRICYQFNRRYNHYWRHIRATDLTYTYGFQGLQLKHFFGWSTERMANRYAHLSNETLVDSMLMGYSNRGVVLAPGPIVASTEPKLSPASQTGTEDQATEVITQKEIELKETEKL